MPNPQKKLRKESHAHFLVDEQIAHEIEKTRLMLGNDTLAEAVKRNALEWKDKDTMLTWGIEMAKDNIDPEKLIEADRVGHTFRAFGCLREKY